MLYLYLFAVTVNTKKQRGGAVQTNYTMLSCSSLILQANTFVLCLPYLTEPPLHLLLYSRQANRLATLCYIFIHFYGKIVCIAQLFLLQYNVYHIGYS